MHLFAKTTTQRANLINDTSQIHWPDIKNEVCTHTYKAIYLRKDYVSQRNILAKWNMQTAAHVPKCMYTLKKPESLKF